jgi:hypothetical protein
MFLIKSARFLAPDIKLLEIEAPQIARKREAGQFVIVRVHERGERVPLTIADSDPHHRDRADCQQMVDPRVVLMALPLFNHRGHSPAADAFSQPIRWFVLGRIRQFAVADWLLDNQHGTTRFAHHAFSDAPHKKSR